MKATLAFTSLTCFISSSVNLSISENQIGFSPFGPVVLVSTLVYSSHFSICSRIVISSKILDSSATSSSATSSSSTSSSSTSSPVAAASSLQPTNEKLATIDTQIVNTSSHNDIFFILTPNFKINNIYDKIEPEICFKLWSISY